MRVKRRNETEIVLEDDDRVHDLCDALSSLPNGAKISASTTYGAAGIIVDHTSTE